MRPPSRNRTWKRRSPFGVVRVVIDALANSLSPPPQQLVGRFSTDPRLPGHLGDLERSRQRDAAGKEFGELLSCLVELPLGFSPLLPVPMQTFQYFTSVINFCHGY